MTDQIEELQQQLEEVIKERDEYHEIADALANGIGEHFRVEIGEHSNANSPWFNALGALAGVYKTDSDDDREIELVTLGSEAIKQALKDVERYRWIRDESKITVDQLHAYLRSRQWHEDGKIRSVATIWHRLDDEDAEILVPWISARDYLPRIRQALLTLAAYEKRIVSEVAKDIRRILSNVITVRIIHDDTSDGTSVLFEDPREAIDAVRKPRGRRRLV